MARMLGFALVTAALLATSSDAAPALTKDDYIARVQTLSASDTKLPGLLDALGAGRQPGCRLCPVGPSASGRAWIRAETRLQAVTFDVVDELESLRPPFEVVQLHRRWLATLRSCLAETEQAIPLAQVEERDSLDPRPLRRASTRFARIWAQCSDRMYSIFERFAARGYDFT
jgi:hypothetical protein